ncbi:MAG: hypothetical protein GY853_03130 [PVC group bacterium]|nr:hypothetical protein [PVC group bacterium]
MVKKDNDYNTILQEWKTLRGETLQSQKQRLNTFRTSIIILAVIYIAYLIPGLKLYKQPLFFQTFILLFLTPIVRFVSSLRLRDSFHACYIENFIKMQLPQVRYIARFSEFKKNFRNQISAAERIRCTYLQIGISTIPFTIGYSFFLFEPGTLWYVRLGAYTPYHDLWLRVGFFVSALIYFIWTIYVCRYDTQKTTKFFNELRQILIKELLTGEIVPYGFNTGSFQHPEAWHSLFGKENITQKKDILLSLKKLEDEFAGVKFLIKSLNKMWFKNPVKDLLYYDLEKEEYGDKTRLILN